MHIAYITQNYPPEIIGGSTRAEDFVRNLTEAHEVDVICPPPTVPFRHFKRTLQPITIKKIAPNLKIINIITYQPVKDNPNFIGWVSYYLTFAILSNFWLLFNIPKYDAVISTSPPLFTMIPGLLMNKIFKKKWIIDIRDLWLDNVTHLGLVNINSFNYKISKRLELSSLKNSDHITVMTDTIKTRIINNYSIDADKFTIVPHSIDTSFFKPGNSDKSNYIIYTGKIRYGGGLDKFVLAMDHLRDQDIKLIIYGDGELKENIIDIINNKNLNDKIILNGVVPRNTIPDIISGCMIGIVPLQDDMGLDYAVPTKLLEFMSCGIPVIATDVGGEVKKIIDTAKCGVLVKNEPVEIAKSIRSLIEKPKERDEMGKSGRQFVLSYCDKTVIIKNIESLLGNMNGRKRYQ